MQKILFALFDLIKPYQEGFIIVPISYFTSLTCFPILRLLRRNAHVGQQRL